MSKMNLSLVPLKRNLFQGYGGKKLEGVEIGGIAKARSGRGESEVN